MKPAMRKLNKRQKQNKNKNKKTKKNARISAEMSSKVHGFESGPDDRERVLA
jgi:hypothetical protein